MRTRDRARPVDMAETVEASQGAIYEALRVMVERGELEREGTGVYKITKAGLDAAVALAETPAEVKPARQRTRFTPPPEPQEAAQEPVEATLEPEPQDATPDALEPLQWALWHDGDLMLRRGEATVVLTLAEVTRLHAWLEAMRTAVQVGREA
jgi:hypothetical protein